MSDWRPSAGLDALRARARLFGDIRRFFASRGVLEVDTPLLSAAGATEPQLASIRTSDGGVLVSSPEFAMKRLLAAGSGPIYQLGHVFRAGERGRWHNPEFVMLEWYRPGWGMARLIDELGDLLAMLGLPPATTSDFGALFRERLDIDPHAADTACLAACARDLGVAPELESGAECTRDFWLDLLLGTVIGPALGRDAPVVVTDFPVCQAGLTRIREGERPVAARFEIYWRGIELANGGEELTDAGALRRRTEADLAARAAAGLDPLPVDRHLAAAMDAGLPECSGVAVGVDRLLALSLGRDRIAEVLPFPADRA